MILFLSFRFFHFFFLGWFTVDEKIIFVLGDKLPRYYNAAIAILTIPQKPKSDKMKPCIQVYVTALIVIWTKSFGVEHILTGGCVTEWIKKLVTNYYNNVYGESHHKQPKKKGSTFVKKSIRQLNRSWREKSLPLSKKREVMNESLLDIWKDMEKVTGTEKIFYEDQNGPRKFSISEEIDLEHAEAKELEETEWKEMLERQAKEEQLILGDTEETLLQNNSFDEVNQLDVSLNHSGYVCNTVIAVDVGLQLDSAVVRPRIHKVRDCQ